MKTHILGLALSSCIVSLMPLPVRALHLSNNGSGQVLLFPYYTVNNENQSLISIVNSTDRGKAARLFFREGRNSRVVMELSIYLAPHDVWTASVFSLQAGGPANIVTLDNSCTVPALKTNANLPALSNGNRYAPFSNSAYTGSSDDVGPDELARTREGHFELIEMGEVTNASFGSLSAITHGFNGTAPACQNLVQAWATGGYWHTNPQADLAPPGGGLSGSVSFVRALNGTMQMVAADAIEGFSQSILHTRPAQGQPTLNSYSGPIFSPPALVTAHVVIDGLPVALRYSVDDTVDAVSAVLMADRLQNEFVTGASVGGVSEWVVTFPTKRFYTDVGAARPTAPFPRAYALVGGRDAAPVDFGGKAWARTGREIPCVASIGGPQCESTAPAIATALNWAANVVTFEQFTDPSDAGSRILGSLLKFDISLDDFFGGPLTTEGAVQLTFWDEVVGAPTIAQQLLRPDITGRRLRGLPVQGFWVASYTNGQLTPGVLSNYSDAVRHKFRRALSPAP